MTFAELVQKMQEVFGSSVIVDENAQGELVVYTGLCQSDPNDNAQLIEYEDQNDLRAYNHYQLKE